jgi:fibronectin type 3 domain-containing protein
MASPVTCVTPRDTFPPAPPRNLAAVGAEGAINLIWEASGAADLAGYLVLRGELPGGTLQVLTTDPVRETTFRDTGVKAGVRYEYVVVAVDTAQPPNRSAESNRVEETAR